MRHRLLGSWDRDPKEFFIDQRDIESAVDRFMAKVRAQERTENRRAEGHLFAYVVALRIAHLLWSPEQLWRDGYFEGYVYHCRRFLGAA